MKATALSLRIAPKKANLIARMVRGMPVPDAVEALRRTNKKGARMVELLLRSAIANASHNDKQDPQMMVIKTIVVNQGTAYRRGMPKARGQMRPYRKFLSHVELVLGFPEEEKNQTRLRQGSGGQANQKKSDESASQEAKTQVKISRSSKGTSKKAESMKKRSSDSSESSVSSDSSARS